IAPGPRGNPPFPPARSASSARSCTATSRVISIGTVRQVVPILPELTCKTLTPTATCLRATGPDDPDGTPKFRNLKRQHGKSNALAGSSGYHRDDAAVPAPEGAASGHPAVSSR